MGPTHAYGARAEKPVQNADFAMKQTNICRLSGDIITVNRLHCWLDNCTITDDVLVSLSESVISVVFSSFQEWANTMARRPSSVRPSVCPSVNFCANRFFSRANGRIAIKLSQDGLQVSVHPGCAQGQSQGQRSRDTFLDSWNELLHHWLSGLAHSKNELMQWRGVRRLSVCLSVCPSVNFCANRFFSHANGRTATKLAQHGPQVSMYPGCAQGQGQGQRSRDTRTFLDSWNERLRHWQSGLFYASVHCCVSWFFPVYQ